MAKSVKRIKYFGLSILISISILVIVVSLLIMEFPITSFKIYKSIVYHQSKLFFNLPDEIPKAELEFKKRIKTSFPIGMSEKDLIKELESQGFQIAYSEYDKQPYAYISIPSGLFCVNYWRIVWQTSDRGNIILIDGSYRNFICL